MKRLFIYTSTKYSWIFPTYWLNIYEITVDRDIRLVAYVETKEGSVKEQTQAVWDKIVINNFIFTQEEQRNLLNYILYSGRVTQLTGIEIRIIY